jgi:hypothetical protein
MGLPRRTQTMVYRFLCSCWVLVAEANGGKVTALASKRLRSACLALAEALRAQNRIARAEAGQLKLTEAEIMGWSDRIGRNHDRCDRILAALGIDRPIDPWEQLIRQASQVLPPASADNPSRPEPHPGTDDAPQSTPDAPAKGC